MAAPNATVDEESYLTAIDERCALVSVTHAYYVNGAMSDIDTIGRAAHEHGALVFVDAYQTAGTSRLDVKASPIDFLAAGTLKYLMGTSGLAFLYVRRELIEQLHPTVTGWFGRANPFAFDAARLDWADRATRFEAGTPAIFPAYVARAGMSMLLDVGLDAIGSWNAELSRRLVMGGRERGLTLHGPGLTRPKTPTTAFRCRGDAHAVESALRQHGVIASARGQVIRLAPHFYTTFDDVDRALDALRDILRREAAA
jgi:selenocysteine lyase/cysteine desulfurase